MNVYGKNDEGEATYPYEQQFRGVRGSSPGAHELQSSRWWHPEALVW